jgi:hypothetical protein
LPYWAGIYHSSIMKTENPTAGMRGIRPCQLAANLFWTSRVSVNHLGTREC